MLHPCDALRGEESEGKTGRGELVSKRTNGEEKPDHGVRIQ